MVHQTFRQRLGTRNFCSEFLFLCYVHLRICTTVMLVVCTQCIQVRLCVHMYGSSLFAHGRDFQGLHAMYACAYIIICSVQTCMHARMHVFFISGVLSLLKRRNAMTVCVCTRLQAWSLSFVHVSLGPAKCTSCVHTVSYTLWVCIIIHRYLHITHGKNHTEFIYVVYTLLFSRSFNIWDFARIINASDSIQRLVPQHILSPVIAFLISIKDHTTKLS